MKYILPALISIALLSSCQQEGEETLSAKEKYEKMKALLKPNIDNMASDFKGAMVLLQEAAAEGYQQAQIDLAGIYMEGGKGIEKNRQKAYEWFARAAEQGNKAAHCFMAEMHYHGAGITKDVTAALKHWEIAAKAGVSEAQFALSQEYKKMEGKAEEGIAYLKQAAEGGYHKAQFTLARIELEQEKNYKAGVAWLERAARSGLTQASNALANIYMTGKYNLEKDEEKAAYWYGVSAQGGDAKALYICALLHQEGLGVERSHAQYLKLLKLSAGRDYKPAVELYIKELEKQGSSESRQEAEAWKKRLADLK